MQIQFIIAVLLIVINGLTANAQILQKDTVQAYKRYPHIQYTTNAYSLQLQNPDTSIAKFYEYNPARMSDIPHLFLGNTGQAHRFLAFEYKRRIGFDLGYRQFDLYRYAAKDVRYFNSPYPFVDVKYIIAPGEEQVIGADFSQSVRQRLNFGLQYRRITSPGIYQRQRTGYHNLAGSVWYRHPKENYQLLASYRLNNAEVEQNGGIAISGLFTDSNPSPRDFIDVSLASAENMVKDRELFLQQTYDWHTYKTRQLTDSTTEKVLKATYRIGHNFSYANELYGFTDAEPVASYYISFYDFPAGNDSVPEPALYHYPIKNRGFKNEFFVDFDINKRLKKLDSLRLNNSLQTSPKPDVSYSIRPFFEHRQNRVLQPQSLDTVSTRTSETGYETLVVRSDIARKYTSGIIGLRVGKTADKNPLLWHLNACYALFGFNLGDFDVKGRLAYRHKRIGEIAVNYSFSRLQPNFSDLHHYSHHFSWNKENEFGKTTALNAGGSLFFPKLKLRLETQWHLLDNYIVYDTLSLPQQPDGVINVWQLKASHQLKWRNLHFDNVLLYQQSTSDLLKLPAFYATHDLYFQRFLFGKALFLKTGFQVRYHTAYFANAYAPQTGKFHLQNEEKIGFYPIIDVYAAFQIRRARMFLKMEHVNEGTLKQKGYYMSPGYPAYDRAFKFGVDWMFFD